MFNTMTDKALTCADCNSEFTFTASEQEFFAQKGFSEPRRCPSCRAARKQARSGSGESNSGGGYSDRGSRQMYTVPCASCSRDATVPFEPTGSKPVYCSDCFSSQRQSYR